MQSLSNALAREEQKLLACIHCGLCLEACPTYVITGNENDGPRGRLYLMRAVAEGRLENTSSAFQTHIDRCLGCRACEQVCPAGVEYGQLLEASREVLLHAQPKADFANKMLRFVLRHVWLSPMRLRIFFGASRLFRDSGLAWLLLKSRLISPRAEFALALLESSRPVFKNRRTPTQTDQRGENVFLFSGCVGEGLFARVNRATARVLRANNFNVSTPNDQVCCGALHAHAGDLEGARELARKNIVAFDSDAPIITNAGGCGAMLTTYGHLFANDKDLAEPAANFSARVRDVSQQLETTEMRTAPSPVEAPVTYDTSCHLLYGQRAGDASERMLHTATRDKFVALSGSERCCGAAGVYNLLQPDMSRQVLNEKLAHIRETNASILATGNPGCQMHIGAGASLAGMSLRVCHPIELVDQAYEQAGFYRDLPMENKTLNQKTLTIVAPLLMLTGIAGFLIPEKYSLLSGATPYNLFHLIFGAIGLVLLAAKNDLWASLFNFGFGLIDLYQALASVLGLTPIQYFHWTFVDDVVHVLLGFALAIIGGYGLRNWKERHA